LAWTINYTESALRQLKKLDKSIALRIVDYMDERVATQDDPRALGKN
jgi:mRNA interferase RelE/StbE